MAYYRLGVLQGDGIGAEIVAATLEVLEAARTAIADLGFEWVRLPVG
jgi:3-isopropylmalate dehydrogenase